MPRQRKKQRERGVQELLREAEVVVEEPKPIALRSALLPALDTDPEERGRPRLRRERRLTPALPPITPADYF